GRVVTASADNTARLWDAQSSQALGAPMRHEGRVWHAAFSPDGRRVVTASSDKTARLWDAQSGQALGAPLRHEGPVSHAAFSPDGRRVVTAGAGLALSANSARLAPPQFSVAQMEGVSRHDSLLQNALSAWMGHALAADVPETGKAALPATDRRAGGKVGKPLEPDPKQVPAPAPPEPAQTPAPLTQQLQKTGSAQIWRIPPYPLSQSSTTRLAPTGAWELPAGLGALGVLAGLTLGQWALRRLALKRRLSEMGA
ncbi:MAG: WD40 repeat domain-containing protein, partial [Pseudomonadota bacterium]